MAFDTALSGLAAASGELSIIGNNIANSSTTGFKESRAVFADVYAVSGQGTAAIQIGSGVRLSDVQQQFTQGNIGFTNNALDLAINGNGFFTLNDSGNTVYSRSGAFHVNTNGIVVNSFNQELQAFQADSAGNITGAIGNLTINTSNITPQATAIVDLGINVNSQASIPLEPVPTTSISISNAGAPPNLDTATSPITVALDELWDSAGVNVDATGAGSQLIFTHLPAVGPTTWQVELIADSAVGSTTPPTIATFDTAVDQFATLSWDSQATALDPVTINVDLNNANTVTGTGTTLNTTDASTGQPQGVFDPSDPDSYNNATSVTVYDSLGGAHLATYYFRKLPTANQWEVHTYVDGVNQGAGTGGADVNAEGTAYILEYATDGSLLSIDGNPTPPSSLTMPAFVPTISGTASAPQPLTLSVDFRNTTQFGAPFAVNAITQDGYTTGQLSTVDVDSGGIVFARYSNGQALALGQVMLTNFSNPNGLSNLGDSSWAETSESGAPLAGQAGSGNLGLIQSGALEESNVDVTEQLVAMITAQRNFQANAQVISTEDSITQTIINIR